MYEQTVTRSMTPALVSSDTELDAATRHSRQLAAHFHFLLGSASRRSHPAFCRRVGLVERCQRHIRGVGFYYDVDQAHALVLPSRVTSEGVGAGYVSDSVAAPSAASCEDGMCPDDRNLTLSSSVGAHGCPSVAPAVLAASSSLSPHAQPFKPSSGWRLDASGSEGGSASDDRCGPCFAESPARSSDVDGGAGGGVGHGEGGRARGSLEAVLARRRSSLEAIGSRPLLRHRLSRVVLISHPLWSQARRGAMTFLVHILRLIRRRFPQWRSGARLPWMCRPPCNPRCCYGQGLAPAEAFVAQMELAELELDWMRSHVQLLTRLRSGEPPHMVDLFCGGGGSSEGARSMGFVVHGVDLTDQPEYVRRFGGGSFTQGDALSRELIRFLVRRHRPTLISASPPCEGPSTATFGGAPSSAPRLIPATRDVLRETGCRSFIENVRGASSEMQGPRMMRGSLFGLRTDRPRLFEGGGGMVIEDSPALSVSAAALLTGCCLGGHARYARLDPFGRAMRVPCCEGNIFTIVGESPRGGLDACMSAMGVDAGHMSFSTLRKALPPVYVARLAGLAAMQSLRDDYGIPVESYAASLEDPVGARRRLQHWRRGAGGLSASAGISLGAPSHTLDEASVGGDLQATSPSVGTDDLPAIPRASGSPLTAPWASGASDVASDPPMPGANAQSLVRSSDVGVRHTAEVTVSQRQLMAVTGVVTLSETGFREVEHSYGGGFTQSVMEEGAYDWLGEYSGGQLRRPEECYAATLAGQSTLLVLGCERAETLGPSLSMAVEDHHGTRAVLIARQGDVARWRSALGVTRLDEVWVDSEGWVALACGHRVAPAGMFLDHDTVEEFMDPVDLGIGVMPRGWKAGVAWSPMPTHDPERWRGIGLPPAVEEIMVRGVQIEAFQSGLGGDTPGSTEEAGQYPFADLEHFVRGVSECDRAIAAGHLVPVPAAMVEEALREAPAHPWTVVHQHADKWRAAQDYSISTNLRVGSKPFTLSSVWDATRVIGPDSHFAKFDLRDGFWSVPVEERSRRYLMVRHPATGQLLWCTSLPFGFALSPLHFCAVTEAVADVVRRRVAGMGIHIFVFVDDFLCVGDNAELTRHGMQVLEQVLGELDLPWARHKRRGPARVMEFLGHLLVNTPVLQCVGLTRARQARVSAMIGEWLARRPDPRSEGLRVPPRELAHLLGHLVFVSEIIPHGRTFMQALLRQFQGLQVDWMRGTVRYARSEGSSWGHVLISPDFWLDLLWLQSALGRANCSPVRSEPRASAAVMSGSDASGFGAGGLVWMDGARAETVLLFTSAETRRPINYRELLGALRVIQVFGPQLKGCTLLLELGNAASVGVAESRRSHAADMQELIRRVVELAALHSITLRSSHTPGADLHRPDGLSRGETVAEPMVRVRADTFGQLSSRFGPFTELLGAERRHQQLHIRHA